MVKTLNGLELLSLYQKKKYIHRLIRLNPEYLIHRGNNWINGIPKEPLEIEKVYSTTNKNGDIIYILLASCSNMDCICRKKNIQHHWSLDENGLPFPNNTNNVHPAFAKYGAFFIT